MNTSTIILYILYCIKYGPIGQARSPVGYYPVTLGFVDLVIARRPKADVAISYPSKVEAVPALKRLTMMPTVSIVTGYYAPQRHRMGVPVVHPCLGRGVPHTLEDSSVLVFFNTGSFKVAGIENSFCISSLQRITGEAAKIQNGAYFSTRYPGNLRGRG